MLLKIAWRSSFLDDLLKWSQECTLFDKIYDVVQVCREISVNRGSLICATHLVRKLPVLRRKWQRLRAPANGIRSNSKYWRISDVLSTQTPAYFLLVTR